MSVKRSPKEERWQLVVFQEPQAACSYPLGSGYHHPHVTVITPTVARMTANIHFPSHDSWNILTVVTFVKKAFVFQTTVTAVRLQNISATPGIPAGFHFLDSRSERDGGKFNSVRNKREIGVKYITLYTKREVGHSGPRRTE